MYVFVGSYNRMCYLENESCHTITKPAMRKTGDRVMIEGNKIIYKGRSDDTIKRFGHRVNLLDIENCIRKHTGLQSACIWIEDKRKLVLFVVVDERKESVITRIKDKLRIKLLHILAKECNPDYIELLPRLPLTQHCKVNKLSLQSRASKIVEVVDPPNKCIIHLFTTLWRKYFVNIDNDEILRRKSFYELGGTSLMRLQFSQELSDNYYIILPSSVYDYIFTNTYENVLVFLEKLQSENKRKISTDIARTDIFKKISNVHLEIKWCYNLQACVDSTPAILRKKR